MEELAVLCAERKASFYDMPLTEGAAGARSGQLVLLTGGEPGRLAALRPVTDAMAREVRHVGPAGAGTRFKLVLNALQAIHLAGFGEALGLAQAAGLDPRQVGTALLDRPGGVVTQLAWDSYLTRPTSPPSGPTRTSPTRPVWPTRRATRPTPPRRRPGDVLAGRRGGRGKGDWSTVNPAAG